MLKKHFKSSAIESFMKIVIFIMIILTAVTIIFSLFPRATLPSSLIVSTLTFSGIFVSITYLAILEAAKSHLIKELPINSDNKSETFLRLSVLPFVLLLSGIIFFISGLQIQFELVSFDLFIFASLLSFYIFLIIIGTFLYKK